MKKFWAVLPLCLILLTTAVFADGIFPDLPEGHWAYTSVEKMVNDGRVNGFPDGEFKPDELVTRWQFAKMAGGDPDIMTEPDRAATRDEAATYLWERAGKPSGVAPSVVTDGSQTPEAIAWAYSVGIVQGDDGLNLRLGSTLTRAEAACLIVRAEDNLSRADFKDTVNGVILERIWNSMQTGIDYNPDATITNGELANLSLCITSGRPRPNYISLQSEPDFSGEYAKAVQLVCQECWGLENANEAFMNQPVTMQNAVAALSLYTMKQATGGLAFNQEATYEDAALTTPQGKLALYFAHYNGIYLTAENKLDAERSATLKDLACVLLQLDEIVGLNRTYGTTGSSKLFKEIYPWPSNADSYAYILEEVPAEIYEVPLTQAANPVEAYEFARDFADTLENFLTQLSATLPKSVKAKWTMYPSLVAKVDNEAFIRAKLEIQANPDGLSLNQMFASNSFTETYTGDSFFIDIATGKNSVGDVIIETDRYTALRAFAGKE